MGDKHVEKKLLKNRLRVRNYRTKKILQKKDHDNEIPLIETNPVIPKKIQHLEENIQNVEEKQHDIVQDLSEQQKVINCKTISTVENGEPVINQQRFSSDESNSESESSDDYASETDGHKYEETPLAKDLKIWYFNHVTPLTHLDELLKTLKPYHPELPECSKTFLKTSIDKCYEIKKFNEHDPSNDSTFVYIGIGKNLKRIIDINLHKEPVLELQFNADGLPLFRSSNVEFWPLLGRVNSKDVLYEPFIITIHSGKGKPACVNIYLDKFVEELNSLLKDGIDIGGKHFDIKVMCFICDRPARAFVKCIKGHTGFYACERCDIKGYKENHRVLYPVDDTTKRTDASFRSQENSEHHHDISPLTRIKPEIDMINSFVLDFMHLGCLGVMKKILTEYWMKSTKKMCTRQNILQVSQRLMNLSKAVPIEFQRTTRSLGETGKWKATEYRFFLLYCGMFVMKGILSEDLYNHFLLLVMACRILCCEKSCEVYADHSEIYLKHFVLLSIKLYGEETLVLNMHSLTHLTDDVRSLKCCLSNITAFPFENKLGQLKKCIRSGNKPLEQLCRRLEQEERYIKPKIIRLGLCKVLKKKKLKDAIDIKSIQFCNCQVTTKVPNNYVLLKNGTIIQVCRIHCAEETEDMSKIIVTGKNIKIIGPALQYPSDSTTLDMFQVETTCTTEIIEALLCDVKCKMVFLSIFELSNDEPVSYAVPLLHM